MYLFAKIFQIFGDVIFGQMIALRYINQFSFPSHDIQSSFVLTATESPDFPILNS